MNGALLSQAEADELLRIYTKHSCREEGGYTVAPKFHKALIEEAKLPESVLHRHFTWDDAVAGQKWREVEAGVLEAKWWTLVEVDKRIEKILMPRLIADRDGGRFLRDDLLEVSASKLTDLMLRIVRQYAGITERFIGEVKELGFESELDNYKLVEFFQDMKHWRDRLECDLSSKKTNCATTHERVFM